MWSHSDRLQAAAKYRAKNRDKCNAATRKTQRAYSAERRLALNLKTKGLTTEQFQKILDRQFGVCAICFTKLSVGDGNYRVDHDHLSNKVRGILCHNCNVGLGHFKDSPRSLQRAIQYLDKPEMS